MKSDVVEINLNLYDTVMHHNIETSVHKTTGKIKIERKNNDNLMLLHTLYIYIANVTINQTKNCSTDTT